MEPVFRLNFFYNLKDVKTIDVDVLEDQSTN